MLAQIVARQLCLLSRVYTLTKGKSDLVLNKVAFSSRFLGKKEQPFFRLSFLSLREI